MIIACVRTGSVYPFKYVIAMRNMIARHMREPYTLVCLTDQPETCDGVTFISTRETGLPGWWAKLLIFEPTWREQNKVIFFDLDTVIINDITPLADVPGEFSILQSPVHLAGNTAYPCRYNSSVMVIGGGKCGFVWHRFERMREEMMTRHARYGDQQCIEALYSDAPFLQDLLPGFFFNYRYLTDQMPDAAVVNFGGRNKPANCEVAWVQREWG
jgi:hypothetical protein